jgi:ribosome modulation factor
MERGTPEWQDGYRAYQEGKRLQSNPYDFGDQRDRWEQGWQEALTDENEKELQS